MIVCSKVANHDVAIKQKAKPEVQSHGCQIDCQILNFLAKSWFCQGF